MLTTFAEQGKLIITDKTKANEILERIGVKPSEREKIISLSFGSLTQLRNNVKNNSMQSTEKNTDSEYLSIDIDDIIGDPEQLKEIKLRNDILRDQL